MQTRTRYICDICHGEYEHKEMCQVCENHPVPERPPIKVGDIIYVISESGLHQKRKVTHEPKIMSNVFLQMQYHYHDEARIVKEDLRKYNFGNLHRWVVRVDDPALLDKTFDAMVPVHSYVEGYCQR